MMVYQYQILVVLMSISIANSITSEECQRDGNTLSYLDAAEDMITKARFYHTACPTAINTCKTSRPIDCEEIQSMGYNISGVYTIWPQSRVLDGKTLEVYCDMDTDGGGWIVLQRRGNFSNPSDYFFKDWENFKKGFGDLEKEFWLGNDNIFALTNERLNSIRFDLTDVEGNKAYALYRTFWIDDEINKYTLRIANYSGNAGDSMAVHNNKNFTTKDQDNDTSNKSNCAALYKGAWWYSSCHDSSLNGFYLNGKHETKGHGIVWHYWKGSKESLVSTEMKIRPTNMRKPLKSP